MYGPADEVDDHHPAADNVRAPDPSEGGGETSTYPFEQWRYRYIDGIGTNIILEFVDTTMTGEYHLTMDPGEKDALLHVPGAGLTMAEQMGMTRGSSKAWIASIATNGMTVGADYGRPHRRGHERVYPVGPLFKDIPAPSGKNEGPESCGDVQDLRCEYVAV